MISGSSHYECQFVVAEGATVGVGKENNRARGLVVSGGGVTVVGKGQLVLA